MTNGFSMNFPVSTGTFVRVKDMGRIGTIACYQCVDENNDKDDFIVMVSGYKESWCDEYLLSELEIITENEVAKITSKLNLRE